MSEPHIQPALPSRVSIDDDVAWQKVDGRVVMLILSTERYYRLDDVGSRMWVLLDECPDVAAAHAQLHEEYDTDGPTLERDLRDFIMRLADAGLIHIQPATP